MLDLKLYDENGRISALRRYNVLDTAREQSFDKITALVQSVLGVPIAAVSLVDQERQWFKSIQGLEVRETPRCVSFCTYTIQGNEPMIVSDALSHPRFSANPLVLEAPHIRSYAGVPLQTSDGYNIGSLCAIDTAPRQFSESHVELLKSFAALVVDELELRLIAQRDFLTGALTRRGFIEQVKKEMVRFGRHAHDSVLVLMDIDHFKSVNDRFGHPAGDEVLKGVASACQQLLRSGDVFGRLGGEEFGLLLAVTDPADAMAAGQRFRHAIEGLDFDLGEEVRITASFGLAPLTTIIQTPESWITQADTALYVAKRTGRNRCIWSDGAAGAAAA